MAGLERIFQPVAGMRPKVACEIRPEGVVAARGGKKHGELTMAFAPLPAGTLAPGLKVPNLADRRAVTSALESALGEINTRNEAVTLVVPDAAARVLLLDFDTLPSKRQEALPIVR